MIFCTKDGVFDGCDSLYSVEFQNQNGWYTCDHEDDTSGISMDVSDAEENANYFLGEYTDSFWKRQ